MKGTIIQAKPFDGYHGIWYYNEPVSTVHRFKYSGGLGTYCADHIPMAIYRPEVQKTFFCYGGTLPGRNGLVHMVSYYDHQTGEVPMPCMVVDKQTGDAHDNPVIAIDATGHIWLFSSSHGISRPSYVHKSTEPYCIESFEHVTTTNFSYPQPWFLPSGELLFLHTRYIAGKRFLFWSKGIDAIVEEDADWLSGIEKGHYQVSWPVGGDGQQPFTVGTAFNYHPEPGGLNFRRNLYYLRTNDGGSTWTTVDGRRIDLPLEKPANTALVHDSGKDGTLIYVVDISFDGNNPDRPVIVVVNSKGFQPGPENGPRNWLVFRWSGRAWDCTRVTSSDSNYDTGCIHANNPDEWKIVAPTEPGPQPGNPGGEMACWASTDKGASWDLKQQLTKNSKYNHTFARKPLNAHPSFLAFWADGDCRMPSESRLYFYDDSEGMVYRLPVKMQGTRGYPEKVK